MIHPVCNYYSGRRVSMTVAIVSICFCFFVVALAAASVDAANVGDPNRGKSLFEKRCGGCHSLDTDKEGPRLRNVFGRNSGTISTFKYSDALRSTHVTWNANLLDKWLTSTESVIPDNDMDFHVPSASERADIIEYLRTTAGK